MKRVLLFLALAAGGILALSVLAGGFLGAGPDAAKPVMSQSRPDAGTVDHPIVHVPDADTGSRSMPKTTVTALRDFSVPKTEAKTWADRVTGERIDFPNYVVWWFRADDTAPVSDAAPGEQGMLVKGIRILVYKDASALSREEARALRADSSAALPKLVRLEITSPEGRADFLVPMLGRDKKAKGMRTIVRMPGDVHVRDVERSTDIRTTNVLLDLEAHTASGSEPVVATSPDWTLSGRGFRVEMESVEKKDAQWLEIEEDARFSMTHAPDDRAAAATPFDLGGEAFRPDLVTSRGGAVVSQKVKDGPVEVRLEDSVHVEQKGGRHLDADAVTLTLVRKAGAAPSPNPSTGGVPGANPASELHPVRLLAEGRVTLGGGDRAASASQPILSLTTDRLDSRIADRDAVTVCEGPTSLSYEGRLAMPGGPPSSTRLLAKCREKLTYGPAPGGPPGAHLLHLAGDANVEATPASGGEGPERLLAPTIDLRLRPRSAAEAKEGSTPPTVVTGFVADGGVRLDGPRLSGRAARIEGSGLDGPDGLVLATGDGVVFEIPLAEETASKEAPAGGMPAATGSKPGSKAPTRWTPSRLHAVGTVRGSVVVGEGGPPATLEGDDLLYEAESGGRLTATGSRLASVVFPERAGEEASVRARTVFFRAGPDGRRVWTESRTKAVLWAGGEGNGAGEAPAATKGSRVLALRGGKAIRVQQSSDPARAATITLEGGGTLGVRSASTSASTASDRLTADSIEVTLASNGAAAGPGLLAPSASSKTGHPAPRKGATAAKPSPGVRWEIDCDRLSVASAADGSPREFTADGALVAKSAAQRFEGRRLRFDVAKGKGVLEGVGEGKALVVLGSGSSSQWVRSTEVDLTLEGGVAKSALFKSPVVASLREIDPKTLETRHFTLLCDGDLAVDDAGASTEGATRVIREAPSKGPDAPSGPLVLTTRRLRVKAPGMLSAPRKAPAAATARSDPLASVKATGIEGFTAEGKGTRVEIGAEGDPGFTRVICDRLEFTAADSMLLMTGEPDVWFESRGVSGTARAFRYDVERGLPAPEGLHLWVSGAPK